MPQLFSRATINRDSIQDLQTSLESDLINRIHALELRLNGIEAVSNTNKDDIFGIQALLQTSNLSQVNALVTDVQSLIDFRTTATEDISILEGHILVAQTDISTLKTSAATTTGLNDRLTTAQSQIGILQTGVTDLQIRTSTAEGSITTLESEMTTVESTLDSLQSDIPQSHDENKYTNLILNHPVELTVIS